MIYQLLIALQLIAFFLAGIIPSFLAPFFAFFTPSDVVWLFLRVAILLMYGPAIQEMMGEWWFAATFFIGVFAGAAFGASPLGSGFLAIIGVIIALDPETWLLAEYV